jgi:glycosyltransferase involved in cell wall biosynthesis
MDISQQRPLVVVTVFNRKDETRRMLASLEEHTDLTQAVVAILNNGSTDGAGKVIDQFYYRVSNDQNEVHVYHFSQNLGTARAINQAILDLRQSGQPVVKFDNDVVLKTSGWIDSVRDLLDMMVNKLSTDVAMIRAYRTWRGQNLPNESPAYWGRHKGSSIYVAERDLGYSVWYTGAFMDRVGHFEVLSPDHVYGFDDVIMGHKARQLNWWRLIWSDWVIDDIQRSPALGKKDGRAHADAVRPLLNERLIEIRRGGPIWANSEGRPIQ